MRRHVRQSIKEEEMKEIVQTVRACGFDFESMPEILDSFTESHEEINHNQNANTNLSTADEGTSEKDKNDSGDTSKSPSMTHKGSDLPTKRKRGEFGPQHDSTTVSHIDGPQLDQTWNTVSGGNEGFGQASERQTSPQKKRRPVTPTEHIDDYWNLENYCDQVISPYIPSDPTLLSEAPVSSPLTDTNLPNTSNSFPQWSSDMPAWMLEGLSQPAVPTEYDTISSIDRSSSAYLIGESTDPSSTLAAPLDWESTMWWDPSLLFDGSLADSDVATADLAAQTSDFVYDVNNGHP
ncbi:hypothetical protein MMC08_009083 [Hypocenomyce scalaris]|nr:hypothetical protein [Hypocenomyce scalaris]